MTAFFERQLLMARDCNSQDLVALSGSDAFIETMADFLDSLPPVR